jgi:hypothetical protein
MNPARPPVARAAWAGLVASALLCGGLWFFTQCLRPLPNLGRSTLPAFDLAVDRRTLAELRHQLTEANAGAWNVARLHGLQERLGAAWQWETVPGRAGQRRCRLTLPVTSPRPWPECLNALQRLGGESQLWIEELDLVANGTGRARRFTTIAVTVGMAWTQDGPATATTAGK